MNILIIDDEDLIRENFIKRIKMLDIHFDNIWEASNGAQALEIIAKNQIDIAIVDINMPFLNGMELIKKTNEISPNTIKIIISGYNDFSYAQKAIEESVFRYLLKPINPEKFKDAITSAAAIALQQSNVEKGGTYGKILSIMQQNYQNPDYRLSQLSAETGFSEGHLSKVIKKHSEKSFSDLLSELRVEQAKKLFKYESASVKIYEVAYKVGFKNQHYFSVVFKKTTGVSPKKFIDDLK